MCPPVCLCRHGIPFCDWYGLAAWVVIDTPVWYGSRVSWRSGVRTLTSRAGRTRLLPPTASDMCPSIYAPTPFQAKLSPLPTNPRRCVQARGLEKKYRAMQGEDDVKHMKKMLTWSYVLYAVGLATSAPTPPDAPSPREILRDHIRVV